MRARRYKERMKSKGWKVLNGKREKAREHLQEEMKRLDKVFKREGVHNWEAYLLGRERDLRKEET